MLILDCGALGRYGLPDLSTARSSPKLLALLPGRVCLAADHFSRGARCGGDPGGTGSGGRWLLS